jgi:hypothetical protein
MKIFRVCVTYVLSVKVALHHLIPRADVKRPLHNGLVPPVRVINTSVKMFGYRRAIGSLNCVMWQLALMTSIALLLTTRLSFSLWYFMKFRNFYPVPFEAPPLFGAILALEPLPHLWSATIGSLCPFRFGLLTFPFSFREAPASIGTLLLWRTIAFPAFPVVARTEQPPRRASAEPEARHVGCYLLQLLCRVSIPGRGAGVQNAGDEGSRWSLSVRWRRLVLFRRH